MFKKDQVGVVHADNDAKYQMILFKREFTDQINTLTNRIEMLESKLNGKDPNT